MIKTYYRQKLPHIQPVGSCFFVTFRLYGSIPKNRLLEIQGKYEKKIALAKLISDPYQRNLEIFNLRKKFLIEYDALLDSINSGPLYFKDKSIMDLVKNELHRFDPEFYDLIAYSIMSNHVHILIDTSIQLTDVATEEELMESYTPLDVIMKRIKGPSGKYANKLLGKHGRFWEKESYDMYIRNEKMLNNVINYILQNPVKARMVDTWESYPGNFYKYQT
jgi:putative transposase